MNAKKIRILVITLCFCLTFVAYANEIQATDYANSEHWLALPSSVDKEGDVFPTFNLN